MTLLRRDGRGIAAGLLAAVVLSGCSSPPEPPKPPPGVTFGKRLTEDRKFSESASEITGSEAVLVRFVDAMRARDPAAIARIGIGEDALAQARSLVRNYARLLDGRVVITFAVIGKPEERAACLNFPSYPYQLVQFVRKADKDGSRWDLVLAKAQGAPPSLRPGRPSPSPHDDRDTFCQDGFAVDGG
ncbi:hypothetical protein [Actinoallomurus sp. NPDC052274]|uniref:hypothetical protein n=1 Tax=Actinoallomurus sp. NPDC052274 TaxID=3155420 RepID=UPI003443EAD4